MEASLSAEALAAESGDDFDVEEIESELKEGMLVEKV